VFCYLPLSLQTNAKPVFQLSQNHFLPNLNSSFIYRSTVGRDKEIVVN
jgi:hypothetical protein